MGAGNAGSVLGQFVAPGPGALEPGRSAKVSVVCDRVEYGISLRQRRYDSSAKGNALVTCGPVILRALKGQNGDGFGPFRAGLLWGDRVSQGESVLAWTSHPLPAKNRLEKQR
jgi:hypothetical protein